MRIIKTNNYKTAQVINNNRNALALKLLEWHGGQSSDLYSVGSSWLAGANVPIENVRGAILELGDIINKKVNFPDPITPEIQQEVMSLKRQLEDQLNKINLNKINTPTDTPMGLEDDNPINDMGF